MLAGVHAWLYKQERVLLIFDNCNMDRSDEEEGQGKGCAPRLRHARVVPAH